MWHSLKAIHWAVPCILASVGAAPALAAGDGPSNPFAGDIGNALWTLIIFALVIIILGKFAWGPILSALQKREDFIRDSLEQARKDREQAEARLKEYSDRLNAARTEATAIVDEGRRDADVVRHKIEQEAKAEATRLIERAKREIGIATETAIKELYQLTGRLSTEVASRVIRKEVNASEHSRLIQESIDELQNAGK